MRATLDVCALFASAIARRGGQSLRATKVARRGSLTSEAFAKMGRQGEDAARYL